MKSGSDSQKNSQKKEKTDHTSWEWLWKFGMSPKCHYCDQHLTLKTATKDHLTPLCRGGSNLIENVVPSCLMCNQAKSIRTEEEYIAQLSTSFVEGDTYSNPKMALEDKANERGLLKRVKAEREKVSWAWRNPA